MCGTRHVMTKDYILPIAVEFEPHNNIIMFKCTYLIIIFYHYAAIAAQRSIFVVSFNVKDDIMILHLF